MTPRWLGLCASALALAACWTASRAQQLLSPLLSVKQNWNNQQVQEPVNVQIAADGRIFVAEKPGRIRAFSSWDATQGPSARWRVRFLRAWPCALTADMSGQAL
jgi:hypothetical protein